MHSAEPDEHGPRPHVAYVLVGEGTVKHRTQISDSENAMQKNKSGEGEGASVMNRLCLPLLTKTCFSLSLLFFHVGKWEDGISYYLRESLCGELK